VVVVVAIMINVAARPIVKFVHIVIVVIASAFVNVGRGHGHVIIGTTTATS
jgi:hypothetical protein